MEELLKSPEFQKFIPYLIGAFIFQIVLWLLFANTIRTTLNLIKKENRCILPVQAWFVALPFFNIYWNFIVVARLRDSLINEFFDRKIAVEENPSQSQGYLYAGSFLTSNFPLPAFINYIVSIVTLVGLIMYWRKIYEYKKILKETQNQRMQEENVQIVDHLDNY